MDRNTKLITQINKLVQLNIDRALGYEKAYSLVESKRLKGLFEGCISQSETYSQKLKSTMIFHGVEMQCKPSLLGLGFRGWMHLKASSSRHKQISVLKSCLDAERMLTVNYDLICENRSLQYYYPLLKFTFMKQQFALKQTREHLEAALDMERSAQEILTPVQIEREPAITGSESQVIV